ncbi:MAG: sugar phosphate isomerase/epimerase [Piscinibacter sp.]|uniref:sugar phosphate isomerase/epimerase family protein n=1 Tax=Piscinibacter sp. TaxID=1903157 RepID=UPI0025857ECE|nr:sugar phosphate isomerase/epimerase [Piscinibacter sp.]MCW5666676.1 sugar phosphate isomerase/epimerase [Piscinibacter sp.]
MPTAAVQLYSLREAGDLDTQLALVKDAGFEAVESVATHGLAPAEFAARVAVHGLRVASMHVSLALLEGERATIVEACRLTGCPLVVMPWLPMGERPSGGAGWTALGRRLAALGDTLQREGLRLAYHNHEFEFLRHDGRLALEWVLDASAPAQLGWEADLGWIHRAGADAAHWLERYADRLVAVHVKDVAPNRSAVHEDGWAVPGQGVLPWAQLLPLAAARAGLFILEHDRPADPVALLRAGRAFLRERLSA